jgi:hypothetical protein
METGLLRRVIAPKRKQKTSTAVLQQIYNILVFYNL